MKTYKKIIRERDEIDKEFCDWCGAEIVDLPYGETFDCTIDVRKGYSYDGDSYGKGRQVEDLCLDCSDKVCKLLEGAGIRIKGYDYG